MEIKFKTQPAPSIPLSIEEELDRNHPEIALMWNPYKIKAGEKYEGRWEIYVELVPNTHNLNKFAISERDKFHNGSIYRYLQVWQNDDESFAPIDQRFLRALRLADTFAHDRFYEDVIEGHEDKKELEQKKAIRELAYAGKSRYFNMNNPKIAI